MEKIKLDILGLSSSQSDVGHFALVLGEVKGNRRLPIIIDGYQARAIALEMESIKPNRPMTHDLFVTLARTFNIGLVEVLITDLKEGIFYAKLVFEQDGEHYEIDSRTSDAVAIGVRFKVPIFTYESVLSVAGIVVSESDLEEENDDYFTEEEEGEEEGEEIPADETIEDKIVRMKREMDGAIGDEDYEKAARLRDEIARLEGENN
ncbi:MAG: bifunctional nuclease family protein [Bacteroidetes bacterium]|nr:bifunctional nuclease family protein [Bacteroidota bacterium]MBL0014870.1 bifunctional nuclease family protein [Bacteroidota bacterium]MBP6640410.1 bifunctional nuclease family protein [Bacteroidia bacterium]